MDDWVQFARAAELENKTRTALSMYRKRHGIVLRKDPAGRGWLYPVMALSPSAQAKYLEQEARAVMPPAPADSGAQLALLPMPTAQPPATPLPGVAPQHQALVLYKFRILGDVTNGCWRKYRGQVYFGVEVKSRHSFIEAVSNRERLQGQKIWPSMIYDWMSDAKTISADKTIAERDKLAALFRELAPKPPHGHRDAYFNKDENRWQRDFVLGLFESQARLSARRVSELLIQEIESRERAAEGKCRYDRPSLRQVRCLLKTIPVAERVLAREGEKQFDDKCGPYISRRPPKYSNLVWGCDQRLADVLLRDQGERLGRIWSVDFLDCGSWKWLGCAFAVILSSDAVMRAAVMAVSRYGVPRFVHHDRGKEFQGRTFTGRFFKISGERLFVEVLGFYDKIGVEPIRAIGGNAKTKLNERFHRELNRFDQELPGWTGSNTDERPEKLKREEAEHEAWKRGEAPRTPLLTIAEYVQRRVAWCETYWNANHRSNGRYLAGLTPNEAYNTRRPEGGVRTITPAELELASSEERVVKVARGEQINVTVCGMKLEYSNRALFLHQGEDVKVLVSRAQVRTVQVFNLRGEHICDAHLKPLFAWADQCDREELKAQIRANSALRRMVRRGVEAQRQLAEGASKPQPALPEHGEISGIEFLGRKFARVRGSAGPHQALYNDDAAQEVIAVLEREGRHE